MRWRMSRSRRARWRCKSKSGILLSGAMARAARERVIRSMAPSGGGLHVNDGALNTLGYFKRSKPGTAIDIRHNTCRNAFQECGYLRAQTIPMRKHNECRLGVRHASADKRKARHRKIGGKKCVRFSDGELPLDTLRDPADRNGRDKA